MDTHPVALLAAAFGSIALVGTALVGLHDAIARIIAREREHRVRADAARSIGRDVLYRAPR